MSVRLRRPWKRQPPNGTPLDPRWIKSELTSVFSGSSFIDVRNGKTWTLAGDAKTSVGVAGLCGSYDGTGDYSYVDTTSQSLTLGATILAVVEPNAAPGTDLRAYGIANGGGSSDYFAIGTGATTAAKARVLEVNTGAGTTNVETAATVFEVGKPHCVILRWVYAVGTQAFVDGNIDNFAANTTALAFTYTRTTAGALGRSSFSNNFNGKVYLGAAWARPLSDAECVALSANPWQLFAPQVRRIWIPQAAAGTTWTISPSGSIVFSGNSPQVREDVFAPGGTVTFSGTSAQIKDKIVEPSGSVVFSGTAPLSFTAGSTEWTISPSGGITFSGAPEQLQEKVIIPSGSLAFSGINTLIKEDTYEPSGSITFSGTAPLTFVPAGSVTVNTYRPLTGVGH